MHRNLVSVASYSWNPLRTLRSCGGAPLPDQIVLSSSGCPRIALLVQHRCLCPSHWNFEVCHVIQFSFQGRNVPSFTDIHVSRHPHRCTVPRISEFAGFLDILLAAAPPMWTNMSMAGSRCSLSMNSSLDLPLSPLRPNPSLRFDPGIPFQASGSPFDGFPIPKETIPGHGSGCVFDWTPLPRGEGKETGDMDVAWTTRKAPLRTSRNVPRASGRCRSRRTARCGWNGASAGAGGVVRRARAAAEGGKKVRGTRVGRRGILARRSTSFGITLQEIDPRRRLVEVEHETNPSTSNCDV